MTVRYRHAKMLPDGRIDCEIEHKDYGWIPFTVDPSDVSSTFDAAALHAALLVDSDTLPYIGPSLEDQRVNALVALKARRDLVMESGLTINGVHVQTDDLSQQRLTAAALAAQLDPASTVRWKTADGSFVTLNSSQIIAIAMAVRAHVQSCFDREAELAEQIKDSENPGSISLDDF